MGVFMLHVHNEELSGGSVLASPAGITQK